MLGHCVGDVVLGVDLDRDDVQVQVDSLAGFLKGAIDVFVGRLGRGVLEHGEHTRVVHEHLSGGDRGFGTALQAGLDATDPCKGASSANEGEAGSVSELVAAHAIAHNGAKSVKLAVVDTRVDAIAELAGRDAIVAPLALTTYPTVVRPPSLSSAELESHQASMISGPSTGAGSEGRLLVMLMMHWSVLKVGTEAVVVWMEASEVDSDDGGVGLPSAALRRPGLVG